MKCSWIAPSISILDNTTLSLRPAFIRIADWGPRFTFAVHRKFSEAMAGKAKARCVPLVALLFWAHWFNPCFSVPSPTNPIHSILLKSMILIRLVSTARTGYTYTTQKNRKYPTFSIKKYDPMSVFIPLTIPLEFGWWIFLSKTPCIVCWAEDEMIQDSC